MSDSPPLNPQLRRVYWETTAACNLRCLHCRRLDVLEKGAPDELTTGEGLRLIDDLSSMGKPVLTFSGGEPLLRTDLFELARHAREKGLSPALATNGTLVDRELARRIREAGIEHASVSIDGASADSHDALRGPGSFESALRGLRRLLEAGVRTQINITVTRRNFRQMEAVCRLAEEEGARALFFFLLVPVGCGLEIAGSQMLSAREVEEWLIWAVRKEAEAGLPIKTICAPHFYRVRQERHPVDGGDKGGRKGCLAGIHMCFVSHKGEVCPCGYLPVGAGSLRRTSLKTLWESSEVFRKLRDPGLLGGRCGACGFKLVCGGCRARAWHAGRDLLAEEPVCVYEPASA